MFIIIQKIAPQTNTHNPNLESASKYGFSPDLGKKNGDVLSLRMQVILDSLFAHMNVVTRSTINTNVGTEN